MLSQILRSLASFGSSLGLIVSELIFQKTLLAAEDPVIEISLNEPQLYSTFLDYLFPKAYFFKIGNDPYLSFIESLIILSSIILAIYALWYIKKPRVKVHSCAGFKLLNLNEKTSFIPLENEIQTLEFLSKIRTSQKYRLSANLNRVTLTPHQNTFLLEDKNYKNALLINRRRSHHTILCDNDVLDIGEMILLYSNIVVPASKINRSGRMDFQMPITGIKPKGPIQKGTPILTPSGTQQDILLIRNINSIGSSNFNDVIISSKQVALRHAKIYKIGESWKIHNLLNHETTTVNGRRIDQRFLQDGDEISIGDTFFRFRFSKVVKKQQRRPKKDSNKNLVKN